jgi:argininosuccinate lyase
LAKMWSGRVSQPLDEHFEQWQQSFGYDRRLLAHECRASTAYAHALTRAGVLTRSEARQIAGALEAIAAAGVDAESGSARDAEDVHHFVELELIARLGDLGRKLHTGRSRNEQIATDLRLYTRAAIGDIRESLAQLCSALVKKARKLKDAPMPAYTHMQRAEPIVAAHWLLAYVEMFLRDAERLADCAKRVNLLPLGSGAIAGCTIPLDRAGMAKELGFDGITENSMDATSDRDFELEFLNALSVIALHLSRFAEDFCLYSTVEFGFVKLPDEFATGSSAMPQKKNPDSMELLRGKTARVLAAAQTLAVTIKGLPLAYDRDLQESQEPLFAATEAVQDSVKVATGFIEKVGFDTARMKEAAAGGYLNATAAANYLVRKGVPFRTAHEIIGKAVRKAIEKGCELEQLSKTELASFSDKFAADFAESVALAKVLAEHDVVGGTAPARVQQALAAAEQRIAALRREMHAHA